jgi:amidohydrolase
MRAMVDRQELHRRVAAVLPDVIELRHGLHRIPELHLEERETAASIRAALAGSRIELLPPLMGTDVVGLLRGAGHGRCLLLRADIDGLPVTERSGAAWASERPGRAHSCGHDGHMAMLVGAARVLEGLADDLRGSVRFVFQPGEEERCGGRTLVEKGLLELDPRPDLAFALHGWVGLPVGAVSSSPGPAMAAADTFTITVRGAGGHAALPHLAVDPVLCAASIVTALQSVVSRGVDPLEPAVLSVTRITGGSTSNVIPDSVELEGTTRYFTRTLQETLERRMEEVAIGVSRASGCECEFHYQRGYIPLVNDAQAVDTARRVVESLLGHERWCAEHARTMGAEDFAFYLSKVPGALLRLGLGEEWPPLHAAGFDFNDRAIETGITTLAGLALDCCGR